MYPVLDSCWLERLEGIGEDLQDRFRDVILGFELVIWQVIGLCFVLVDG